MLPTKLLLSKHQSSTFPYYRQSHSSLTLRYNFFVLVHSFGTPYLTYTHFSLIPYKHVPARRTQTLYVLFSPSNSRSNPATMAVGMTTLVNMDAFATVLRVCSPSRLQFCALLSCKVCTIKPKLNFTRTALIYLALFGSLLLQLRVQEC